MMDLLYGAIGLVIYLAVGWRIAYIVDTESVLLDVLVILFWPAVVILTIFARMLWG